MPFLPADLYDRWRSETSGFVALRETAPDDPPSELLLQRIWHYQRLQREGLRSVEGEEIGIFHPGFWNREAGPDFREAVVQVGDGPACVGDVEVDLSPSGWVHHRHVDNPEYKRVCLHVVWESGGKTVPALPTLELKGCLDAPLDELRAWSVSQADLTLPLAEIGKCEAPLQHLTGEQLEQLLHQAAEVRLKMKASRLAARAKAEGWEQALWEEVFTALGYKQNVWPMRRLGEWRRRVVAVTEGSPNELLRLQARLLGVGNLLPAEFKSYSPAARRYLRQLWDVWWRERQAFGQAILPRPAWRFSNVRPANHPQRRLALAAHWLANPQWRRRLESWFKEEHADQRLAASLLNLLAPKDDVFWSHHWTLRSSKLGQPQPLLGPSRLTDLAVNVFLPWFWSRATTGANRRLRQLAEQRYFAWPAAQDNAVLRRARRRMFGTRRPDLPRTAAMQQGLIQIARDFCEHSNALCDDCQFPQRVAELE